MRWSGGAEVWGVGDCTGCCLPARLCSPLCDPVDCSPPGFSVHGILQARILAWVAVYLLQGISLTRDQGCISCLAGGFFTTEPAGKPGIAHTQAVHRTEHYPCRSCSGSVREREAGQASRCWARRCLINCVKKSLLQRKVLTVLVGM